MSLLAQLVEEYAISVGFDPNNPKHAEWILRNMRSMPGNTLAGMRECEEQNAIWEETERQRERQRQRGREQRERKRREQTIQLNYNKTGIPEKSYVYGWLDGDRVFYVGKGKGERAWKPHIRGDDKKPSACERQRQRSNDFKVVIYCHNLEDHEAYLVESVLIATLKPRCNMAVKRKEVVRAGACSIGTLFD